MANKGIIMIAGGHPEYGMMARNLALGIRSYSDMEIALISDEVSISHFTEQDKKLFTIIPLPVFTYTVKDKMNSYYRVKTLLPELTPFDETVLLDVDMVWCPGRKAEELFELDTDFTMINEGYMDFSTGENTVSRNYHFWARPESIKQAYELKDGRLYQYRSEFIYFKNTEKNKEYFSLARKIYDHPKFDSIRFGDILPDEIAFSVASILLKHYPHKANFSPIYWDYLYAFMRLERGDIYKNYYGYSMGGKQVREIQKNLYNDLVKFYCNQNKVSPSYLWSDKINFSKHHQQKVK